MDQRLATSLLSTMKAFHELVEGDHPDWLDRGLQVIPLSELELHYYPPFNTGVGTLIDLGVGDPKISCLQEILFRAYPEDTTIYLVDPKNENKAKYHEVKLSELGEKWQTSNLLVLPPLADRSTLEQFMDTVTHLRAPEGCPWDRKQTHASLRTYLMEETFEALEALDRGDPAGVREELGDILLQIALHAVIANETGAFNISDVIAGIDRKIISRHPHVFGDVIVEGEKDVLTNWDKLKREEKEENGASPEAGILEGVPAILPSLAQAQALQQRAAQVGFDWPEITPVLAKVFEELEELKSAPGKPQQAEELGDLLFALVNLVRWYEVDAESALRQANHKFRNRFAYIEKRARETGREMTGMSLEEMDVLWEEAKDQESKVS